MKTKYLLALSAWFFSRSLLAGENDVPSRASTLPQDTQPAANPAAPDACCKEKVAADQPAGCSCCRDADTAAFSKESLYQLEGKFTDDSGRVISLGELRGRPVVLDMFFASCGYACPLTVTDLLALQGRLPAELRDKAVFVLVSFDPARDTPAALAHYRAERRLDGQWKLLQADAGTVRELAALLGVKFKQEADGAFSHSNVVTILNAEGEIVHQRLGLQGGLDEAARALAAALKPD
jgi:protein SCO1/2